jgi:hypothetical protein
LTGRRGARRLASKAGWHPTIRIHLPRCFRQDEIMSKPKVFIGSSQKNLRVARLIADGLEECAHARPWDEGVFGLNEGNLEALLEELKASDFAVFVLAADDMTTSKEETRPSPRDNVLFECGLFMGVLGRDHVFIAHDHTVDLKIPSDLAGITLATYDGSRIDGEDAPGAVRKACRLIGDVVKESRYPHLVGEWQSIYPMTFEAGNPLCEEVVEIRPARDGISIVSKLSNQNDFYTAFGRLPQERQIIGEWKSRAEDSDTSGTFILTVSPNGQYMYGYFTSPDEQGGVTYASWVLAKKAGADDAKVAERLKKAREILVTTTIGLPSPPPTP